MNDTGITSETLAHERMCVYLKHGSIILYILYHLKSLEVLTISLSFIMHARSSLHAARESKHSCHNRSSVKTLMLPCRSNNINVTYMPYGSLHGHDQQQSLSH